MVTDLRIMSCNCDWEMLFQALPTLLQVTLQPSCHCLHFTESKMETPQGQVTCPGGHSVQDCESGSPVPFPSPCQPSCEMRMIDTQLEVVRIFK